MAKTKLVFVLLLFSFILIGCQNNNLNLSDDVTSIEVYEWESQDLVATIEDKEFIEELVNELDRARTASTASMDFDSPDYEVHFNHNEETLFKMGYYKKVMNLEVEGRYWDFGEDRLYNVELQLPFRSVD
ncbi:DUF5301 domain-containing protein [Aquisalibacillus elongatus]|uniref:Uncharacterized protein DUF5300 n=1 Tax=Aquisalibacillus elongatus TaxID=485577 RepID=A0A3N5AYW6_9BACI|nr:DUF5301 domain-containing protein [Aquisalibacillus elongatus]RPF50254.1 uncharacterized protein DUF5300 [Aquisalibacillus elongatus]